MRVDSVAVLDCGGQYTKVIDRRVRETFVKSDIFPIGIRASELVGYDGLILSGGPASVWSQERPDYDGGIFELGIPVLGICYGMHLINEHFGGRVRSIDSREYGETIVRVDTDCPLFHGLSEQQTVLMSHGDSVEHLSEDFAECAQSDDVTAAIRHCSLPIYGVQFHPEVDLTVNGKAMLKSFLHEICGLTGNYVMEDRIEAAVADIRARVGRAKVVVLVSGGVDSAVTAALLLKALDRDQVYGIHVDHGLMRKGESDRICENLEELGFAHLYRLDSWERFRDGEVVEGDRTLGPLSATIEPEEKRRIIGNLFVEVVAEASRDLGLDFEEVFLAQGTLRPDLIESGNPDVSGYAHRIKTHHNDVDVIRYARSRGRVIETNADWHKDEVREVARRLGIEEAVASRQPFPGPGLAIRCLCTDGQDEIAPEQDAGLRALLPEGRYSGRVVPLRTVGVQGDNRSYRHLAVLKSTSSPDWKELADLGGRIPNKLDYVNRVGYTLRGDPTIASVFPCSITRENMDLLREVDALVRDSLDHPPVSQVFPVLLPFGSGGRYSIAIRAIITNDYMTGRPAWVGQDVRAGIMESLVAAITRISEIDLILYDITGKPPATVEWE